MRPRKVLRSPAAAALQILLRRARKLGGSSWECVRDLGKAERAMGVASGSRTCFRCFSELIADGMAMVSLAKPLSRSVER